MKDIAIIVVLIFSVTAVYTTDAFLPEGCSFANIPDRYTDLRTPSCVDHWHIEGILQGTGLEGSGIYFVEAETRYNVNAIFLASVAILESGWGTSRIFQEKNNPFGFRAYTATPYDSAMTFDSLRDAIFYVAEYLATEYLDENGRWYTEPTMMGVNKNYADDPDWYIKVESIARRFAVEIELDGRSS